MTEELSREARLLFDAARAGHEPSAADGERVLHRVLVQTAAATSTSLGLATKAAIWMIAGGLSTVAVYGAVHGVGSRSAAPPAAVARQPAVESAAATASAQPDTTSRQAGPPPAATNSTETVAPPLRANGIGRTVATPLPEVGKADSARSASVADSARSSSGTESPAAAFPDSAPPLAQSSTPVTALGAEARALAVVQQLLRAGRNAEALALVEQEQREFAHGELGQEREAARIVALCAVGRVNEARAAAVAFLAVAANSPIAARIRATCASP